MNNIDSQKRLPFQKCFICRRTIKKILLIGISTTEEKTPLCEECKGKLSEDVCALIEVKPGKMTGKAIRTGKVSYISKDILGFIQQKNPNMIPTLNMVSTKAMNKITELVSDYTTQINLMNTLVSIDSFLSNISLEEAQKNYNNDNYTNHLFNGEGYTLSECSKPKLHFNRESQTVDIVSIYDTFFEEKFETEQWRNLKQDLNELALKIYRKRVKQNG